MCAAAPHDGPFVVSTHGLTKTYGTRRALEGVDLAVPPGSIYGLVGPNGAGKTTLIAILAGLRRPSAGTVEFAIPRDRVAVLPDTPQFEPWLTAREVVDLARELIGGSAPRSRVDEAMEATGVSPFASVRVSAFSRGMLQRLGLAATVVAEPELLILDEPSSALDPQGRHDVLGLVAALGRRSTVLFSSHILEDVQRVCDTVGVLGEGRMLFQGSLDDLLTRRLSPAYIVRVRSPAEAVVAALAAEPWVAGVADGGGGELRVTVTAMEAAERRLPATLAQAGARVVAIEPAVHTLESAFLELVGPSTPLRPGAP